MEHVGNILRFCNRAACLGSCGNAKNCAVEVQTKQGNPTPSGPRHQAKNHHAGHKSVTHIFVTSTPQIRDVLPR